jgi:hypothetical protein
VNPVLPPASKVTLYCTWVHFNTRPQERKNVIDATREGERFASELQEQLEASWCITSIFDQTADAFTICSISTLLAILYWN